MRLHFVVSDLLYSPSGDGWQVPRAEGPGGARPLLALVAGTGVSTTAVHTCLDGPPGLWRAVRQEGATGLAQHLAGLDAVALHR